MRNSTVNATFYFTLYVKRPSNWTASTKDKLLCASRPANAASHTLQLGTLYCAYTLQNDGARLFHSIFITWSVALSLITHIPDTTATKRVAPAKKSPHGPRFAS